MWFASVYRQFKDINTFMEELNTLLKDKYLRRVWQVVWRFFHIERKMDLWTNGCRNS